MGNIARYLVVAFKGICMGAADVIPGVSGGTIAFLMGIYQELVDSIKSISLSNIKLLLKGRIFEFWKVINGNFLVSLVLGILISIFSLARAMKYLLEFHPVPLWSFFFGLILASAVVILRQIDKWNIQNIIALVAGIAIAAYICLISPSSTPDEYWFIFISGAIAICAMILPGVSGSFILLLMGKYHFIMSAVSELNIPVLCIFGAGAVLGILSFSHLLSWLLKKFYMATIALLSGFMIGSLIKVWPWKEQIVSASANLVAGGEGAPLVDHPVLPGYFEQITGNSSQLGLALLFAVVGIIVVVAMEWASAKKENK